MLNRLVLKGDKVLQRLLEDAGRQWQHQVLQEWVGVSRPPL